MLRKIGLLSLATAVFAAHWCSRQVAASPPSSSTAPSGVYNVEATLSGYLMSDLGGAYVGGQQGVKCGIDYQSHDFLFNPQDYHYSPPRTAAIDMSSPVPDPCSVLTSLASSLLPQPIQYLIVRQVDTVGFTSQNPRPRNAQIVLPNGTLRFGSACAPQLLVTLTSTNPKQWTISTQGSHIGELVQSIKGTTQVVGYYYVPFQIQITAP
jgi:hypothetical protein